ncbi:hypothetical protein [Streptomyces sp. NPDC008125]|uniref:hypothetical protein n=1 Tax=Streptomyces sp. NPDC008125 TaxID=3364811 RepID=UPI0036E46405
MSAAWVAGLLAGYGIAVPVGAVATYLVALVLLGRVLTGPLGRSITSLISGAVIVGLAARLVLAPP